MAIVLDVVSWILIGLGCVFALIGAFGVVKLPDVFARMHGASLIETMGAGGILIGLMFQSNSALVTVKLVLILAFLFFTNPTTTHALARALRHAGVRPYVAASRDEGGSDMESTSSKT